MRRLVAHISAFIAIRQATTLSSAGLPKNTLLVMSEGIASTVYVGRFGSVAMAFSCDGIRPNDIIKNP